MLTSDTDDLEEVRRDLASIRSAHRDEAHAERERWFRVIGYVTRPLVYLVVVALLYLWLAPSQDMTGRALGSFTVKEVSGFIFFICALIFWWRLFFNADGAVIQWEAWGKFGLGLAAVATGAALWLGFQ